jgi:excisionase family DNA binding protein
MVRFDPLRMLGCDETEFRELMHGRRVTPGEVEAAVSTHYRWREHVDDHDSYWVTVPAAARMLGTSVGTVRRMLDAGRLPYVALDGGVSVIERQRVESLADARRRSGKPARLPHQRQHRD